MTTGTALDNIHISSFTLPPLLSIKERTNLLQQTIHGLYRWYLGRSFEMRHWNADLSFNWGDMRTDHSDDHVKLIEGFFAVEQYVPDYTSKIIDVIRQSSTRTDFQLQWGGEEQRHADTWENALLFSGQRTPEFIEDYKNALRTNEWRTPWDDPLHMLAYTVFQERGTQLTYLNFAGVAGSAAPAKLGDPAGDPVLEKVCKMLARDEAAHYAFFLDCFRLYLYYFPADALSAMYDVLMHFQMPAHDAIPNWPEIEEAIYRTGVYGTREFGKNVLAVVFNSLGVKSRKAVERGIKESRKIPGADGAMRDSSVWQAFDPSFVGAKVQSIVDRAKKHAARYGRGVYQSLEFVPNPAYAGLFLSPTAG